jgi:hypothetical protein
MSLVLGKLHMEPSEQLAEHAEVTLAGRAYDALLMERMKGNDG